MKNKTFYFSKIMLLVLIFSNFSTNFLIAQPADSPWPMFRHDAQNTGRSSIIGPTTEPKLAWIFDGDLKTAPVIGADNTIYTANKVSKITYDESNLIALNSNGAVKWQYRLANNLIVNGIAISQDYIYLTTSSGYVNEPMPFYIFKHDGTLKHEDASIHDGSPPVIGKDGTVYVNIEYKLYAINPDGSIKWTVSHGIWRHPAPAIGPNADIYIISDDFLFSYNVDGKLNWKAQKGDDAGMSQTSPIIADDGTIYVSGYSSHKFSAFRSDGTKKWDYTIIVIQQPCIGPDGTIYFIGIKDRFDTQKILYALNPDGTLKWNLNGEFRTLMVDTNGKIFVQGWKDQKLYSINSEGKITWTYDVGLSAIYLIDCSPVLNSNADLYFVAEKRLGHSALYALTDISTKDTVDVSIADTNITFDPSLPITPGKEIIVDVVIKELSGKAAALCNVSFYLNNLTTLKETKSVYVTKDAPCTVQFKWNTAGLIPGNYTIFIVIDKVQPFEQNLTNNQAQKKHVLLRTIQSQIDAVTSGTITIKPGIYYENIMMKPNITLKSECGYDSTIIDGGSQTTVIDMPWWKDNMHIEGFTIRNGRTGIDMDSPYNASVLKCRVVNNNTGIYVYGIRGNNIVANNIIENNTVGIDGNNPKFQVYNNTIVKNSGVGIKSIGYYESTPDIDNCIIWGNGDDLGETAKAEYSCIEDRDPGTGNIHDNPLFVDYENADYRLQPDSPCIDAGDPASPRDPDGTRADMGWKYYDQSATIARIMGRLTDATTGAPVTMAKIYLSGPRNDLVPPDAKGNYVFAVPADTGYRVSVFAPNHSSAIKEHISANIGAATVIDFSLTPYPTQITLYPPSELKGTYGEGKVHLNWQRPIDEQAFDDGYYEAAIGFKNSQGILAAGPFKPTNYPAKIEKIKVAFDGEQAGDKIELLIYLDNSGTTTKPSSSLLVFDRPNIPIEVGGGFQEIDVSNEGLTLNNGSFFIGIKQANIKPMYLLLDQSSADGHAFVDDNLDGVFENLASSNIHGALAIRTIVSMPTTGNPGFFNRIILQVTNTVMNDSLRLAAIEKNLPTGLISKSIVTSKSSEIQYEEMNALNLLATPPQSIYVYRSISSPVELSSTNKIATLAVNATYYDDMNLGRSEGYFYIVAARYADGTIIPSEEISVSISTGVNNVTSKTIPAKFELAQNNPNPFNPETTIKYQLPEPSEVTIRIFNITGQVVKTMLEEHRPAGYHSILWDGKDDLGNHVTSGVYFYQLRARSAEENFIETRKMILVH